MNTAAFKVESANIIKEAERHFMAGTDGDSAGMVMGLNMIRRGLYELGERALELGDARLIEICQRLCLIRAAEDA